jgi:hypothetical protein
MLCPEALEFGSLSLRSGIYAIKRRLRPHCEEFFDVGFCQQTTRVLTGVFMRIAGGSSGLGTVETARQIVNRKKLMLQPETLQVASLPQRAVSEFERDNSGSRGYGSGGGRIPGINCRRCSSLPLGSLRQKRLHSFRHARIPAQVEILHTLTAP